MFNLLKLSYFNVKNIIRSKEFILLITVAFVYSIFWIIMGYIRHFRYDAAGYSFEFGRFLFVVILYASISVIRNDIKANVTKALFTGIFTRTKVMISKVISLIMLGIVFGVIIEVNSLFVCMVRYNKIGISEFLSFNHIETACTYIAITFSMGALILLILSITFNENKNILFVILFLSMINFYNAGIITLANREPQIAQKISTYAKTPFYICSDAAMSAGIGGINVNELLIATIYGLVFSVFSIVIINRREVR